MNVPVLEGVPPGVNVLEGDGAGLADLVTVAVRVTVPDPDEPNEWVRLPVGEAVGITDPDPDPDPE